MFMSVFLYFYTLRPYISLDSVATDFKILLATPSMLYFLYLSFRAL